MRPLLLLLLVIFGLASLSAADRPPNIIFFLTDDQGYADLGCFGARRFKTPNFDRMAAEGMKFTSFYVAQPVCTASRAAMLTGCYSNRVGLFGALNHTSTIGISEQRTARFRNSASSAATPPPASANGISVTSAKFSPLRHGFDEFAGLPYPNDNGPDHPTIKGIPPLPLFEGEEITGYNPDQNLFTRKITELGVQFIEQNKDRPFFLYLAAHHAARADPCRRQIPRQIGRGPLWRRDRGARLVHGRGARRPETPRPR